MLATLDPGFARKVQYYQSSTLERIQSVSLPKEASDWTRCQEYTRDVVPVNWSARPWRLSCRRGKHLRGLTGCGRATELFAARFLDSLAIFPAAGNVRRIWLGNAKGLVRLLVFSVPLLFFRRVDATALTRSGRSWTPSSYPRTTTSRSRKSPEGDERETIRRRWFWYPAKWRIPYFPSDPAGIAQLQSRISLHLPFSAASSSDSSFFSLSFFLSFLLSFYPNRSLSFLSLSSLYTDLPQGLICHRRNEQDFMRALHLRSWSSNRRDCRVCAFYEFKAVAPTSLHLSGNWIPTIVRVQLQFITL